MKKIFIVFLFFVSASLFAQKVTEKKILVGPEKDEYQYYVNYDENSGTYVKMIYDSEKNKYHIISNKGDSKEHESFGFFKLIFDSEGNYYLTAEDYIGSPADVKSIFYFIKNGKEIYTFNYLNENIITDGRNIYFQASDTSGDFMVKYNIKKDRFEPGKKYEYISFCYSPTPFNYNYTFIPGLTKNNEVYYIASSNEEEFLVIGEEEQKHYSSITNSSYVTEDKKGNLCYIATKAENDIYHTVLVQGDKEYTRCYNARGPILFTDNNIPVYLASDNPDDLYTVHNLYIGNEKGKYYKGEITEFAVSKSGKTGYIVNENKNDSETVCFVVSDSKEGKRYYSINSLSFTDDDKPVYIAWDNDKSFVVTGTVEQKFKYSSIMNLTISPEEKIAYLGENNFEIDSIKNYEYYYHIGEKIFGPYKYAPYEYEITPDIITFDESGNYVYMASDNSNSSPDITLYKLYSKNWESESFDYCENMKFLDGNVYYTGFQSKTDLTTVYKNKTKISGDYNGIFNYKFDADNEEISFIGLKNNTYYFVKIEL